MRGVTTSPWQVTATPHWLNFSSQVVLFIFHMNEASVCTPPFKELLCDSRYRIA